MTEITPIKQPYARESNRKHVYPADFSEYSYIVHITDVVNPEFVRSYILLINDLGASTLFAQGGDFTKSGSVKVVRNDFFRKEINEDYLIEIEINDHIQISVYMVSKDIDMPMVFGLVEDENYE